MPAPDSLPPRRAVVDIGTNSVKLLVGDVTGNTVTPVFERSRQTRLGRGFYHEHRLQPGPIADTAAAVAAFQHLAQEHEARAVRVVATSAAREAVNVEELSAAVRSATGLEVEVIPGDTEARWAFDGVMSDPRLHDAVVLLLDVGGGSTEFILGRRHEVRFRQSHRLGVVRLLEQLAPAEPPTATDLARGQRAVKEFLEREVAPGLLSRNPSREVGPGLPSPDVAPRRGATHLGGFPADSVQLVGTGGTASILGAMALGLTRFDREALDGQVLTRGEVAERLEQLWSWPIEQRRQLPGLPPERADVILTGVLIYDSVMEVFGFPALRITTRSLRYAALVNWPAVAPA
jgi:exopolyphosphatase/guanosine-5'-triphosphate,3'-diphosphate pyrophosphatase